MRWHSGVVTANSIAAISSLRKRVPARSQGYRALVAGGTPRTRYARSGDVSIAYQVFGDGPLETVWAPGFVTHLDLFWEHPLWANMARRAATWGRVAIFDKRGTGLSDRPPTTA